MGIAEILQNANIVPKYGEINLGCTNGWSESIHTVYEDLKSHRIDGTNTQRELGRCLNEYSFTINDGTDEYILVYTLDSSD